MGEMTDRAEGVGQRAQQSEWMDKAIRAGLVAYGVVHLLVGWLALQLAFGESEGKASNKGAMQELAQQPFGEVLVWAIAIGMFLLVIWRGLETFVGHQDKDEGSDRWKARAVSAMKAIIYAAVGITALNVVIGAKSSKGGSTWTKTVMEWPAGQWIVAAVGVAVIIYGANHVRKGFTEDYAKHLDAEGKSGNTGKAYLMFGKVGLHRQGHRHRHRGRPDPLRRPHPRPEEVRQPRPGAAQAADLPVRADRVDRGRRRDRLLRAVLLRPRPAPVRERQVAFDG